MEQNMEKFYEKLFIHLEIKTSKAGSSSGELATSEFHKALSKLVNQKLKLVYMNTVLNNLSVENKLITEQITANQNEMDSIKIKQKEVCEEIESLQQKKYEIKNSFNLKMDEIINRYKDIDAKYTPEYVKTECEVEAQKTEKLHNSIAETKKNLDNINQMYDNYSLEVNPAINNVFPAQDSNLRVKINYNTALLKLLRDKLNE